MLTFKNYINLVAHTLICLVILLSLPTVFFILGSVIWSWPSWVTVITSVTSAFVTIYFMLKYIWYVVNKGWIF